MAFIFTKYRRHFAALLFILTGLLVANIAFNTHLHIYKGHVVSHAHPYHKDNNSNLPVKSHQHSDFEFFILDQISNPLVIVGTAIYITTILIFLREISMMPEKVFFKLPLYSLRNTRAPPVDI